MELLGIEMPYEEFDKLICQQNEGKVLVVENNRVVAKIIEKTIEETKQQRIGYIKEKLNKLSEDCIQQMFGEKVPDYDKRKEEFVKLHNELRVLEGKKEREIANI